MPAPTPDVGKPDWHLRKNRGVYTLRVAIFFNVYHWERYFWVCVAYAVVLERYTAMARAKAAQEAQEAQEHYMDGERPALPA